MNKIFIFKIMSNQYSKNKKTRWLGIFLVSLGAYFLLRNFGWIPAFLPGYLLSWEMVFILIGIFMLVARKMKGVIFLVIGVVFILPDIFYWSPYFRARDLWPVILIAVGISIFLKRRYQCKKRNIDGNDADFLEDTSIFGGSEKFFASQNFQGGKVTSIFGGSEIDFSQAVLAEEVTLDVFCFFGGNTFRVPNDWTVINESFVIFGGYADKRSSRDNDPKKVLRIKGSVVFGGMEVRGA